MTIKMSDQFSKDQNQLQKLNRRKTNILPANKHLIPKEYKEFAANLEKQFSKDMLEKMHKTTGQTDSGPGASFYRSLLTSERADLLAKNKNGHGLGIQDLILDQVYPRRQRSEFAFNQHQQKKQLPHGKKSFKRMTPDQAKTYYQNAAKNNQHLNAMKITTNKTELNHE